MLGFDLDADGKPRPLPPLLPVKGHVAATRDTLAIAVGDDSSAKVSAALAAAATRSLLFVVVFDYQKMAEILARFPNNTTDLETFKLFGLGTLEAGVDDRGLYMSGTVELK
jgi:hypothetical protein